MSVSFQSLSSQNTVSFQWPVQAKNKDEHHSTVFLHSPTSNLAHTVEVANGTELFLVGAHDDASFLVKHEGLEYTVKKHNVVMPESTTLKNRESCYTDIILHGKGECTTPVPNGTEVRILCVDPPYLKVLHNSEEYSVQMHHSVGALAQADSAMPLANAPPADPQTLQSTLLCTSGCGKLAAPGHTSCCRTCERSHGQQHGPRCAEATALVAPTSFDWQNVVWTLCCCGRNNSTAKARMANASGPSKVFMCNQQTSAAIKLTKTWLRNSGVREPDVKASMPQFNRTKGVNDVVSRSLTSFDVPVYGPALTRAVLALFQGTTMHELAKELKVPIPRPCVNRKVQKKMPVVRPLVAAARLMRADEECISKLEKFIDAVENLQESTVNNDDEWAAFVRQHCTQDYERKLHVDDVLTNFGFDRSVGLTLKQDYSTALRWLSKAFAAYGVAGSMCDIVNLMYAMLNKNVGSTRPSASEILGVVEEFGVMFANQQWERFWLPSHLIIDCEVDDCLAWLLLNYIHVKLGSTLQVLVQLPVASEFDKLAQTLQDPRRVTVFRDCDSANGEAVKVCWRL